MKRKSFLQNLKSLWSNQKPKQEKKLFMWRKGTKQLLWNISLLSQGIRELKQQRQWCIQKTSLRKWIPSASGKLYCACSISFNSSDVGEFFWSSIPKDCIKVEKKKKEVVVLCSRSQQKVKLGSSCHSRAMMAKKCTKKCDAHAKLLFCQSKPTVFLPTLVAVVVAVA